MLPDPVLVTGGAGFIGSALTKALLHRGHHVTVMDDLSRGRSELLEPSHERCRFIRGDIRDRSRVGEIIHQLRPRMVFHLAAIHYIPYCNLHPVEVVDVNINGTRNLLSACMEAKPELLFFASTGAVYPSQPGHFTEEDSPGPVDIYGYTKLAAEELVRLFAYESGVKTTMGRYFNVYGENDTNPHLIPEIIDQIRQNGPVLKLGNFEPVRDYINVQDVVDATLAITERHEGGRGLYNVGCGRGFSVREVVTVFEKALGISLKVVQEASRVRKVERPVLVADIRRLSQGLGWSPGTGFEQGIARLFRRSG